MGTCSPGIFSITEIMTTFAVVRLWFTEIGHGCNRHHIHILLMTLHIFNPSHDEALAAHSPYHYPSTIARRLQAEWGALPALWALPGDAVWLSDGVEAPLQAEWCKGVSFVHKADLLKPSFWKTVDDIDPWGWDAVLRQQLRRCGAPERLLPTDGDLDLWRMLSSRYTTSALLPRLRSALAETGWTSQTVGESRVAASVEEALSVAKAWGGAVAKSLWSCSGRGVFRISLSPSTNEVNRLTRLIKEQGGVELEPIYTPRTDFALEFEALPSGNVHFVGLSLFSTSSSGAYSANRVGASSDLLAELQRSGGLSADEVDLLASVCEKQLSAFIDGRYVGPLGMDMMMVETSAGVMLNPCIEVNLRRTMGHMAHCLAQRKLKLDDLPEFFHNLCYICNP